MPKAGPFHPFAGGGVEQFSRFHIGDMAAVPADAPLEKKRVGALLQHLRIIIALDDHSIERADYLVQAGKYVPEVGQNTQPAPPVIDDEHHPVRAVVWGRDSLNADPADADLVRGLEVTDVIEPAQLASGRGGLARLGRDVNRQAELALVDSHASGVVGVVVGNEQGVNVSDIAPAGGQAQPGLPAGDPGIEQQPRPQCLHVDAVSVAAGLQRYNLHERIIPPRGPV